MTQEEAMACPSDWKALRGLYKEAINLKYVGCVVEIGVGHGYSLFALAQDHPEAVVMGVDDFSADESGEARKHLQDHIKEFPNVRLIEEKSDKARKMWSSPELYYDIDILHIDGDPEEVYRDFHMWVDPVAPGGVVLFHGVKTRPQVAEFFAILDGEKEIIDEGEGLGIWFKDA